MLVLERTHQKVVNDYTALLNKYLPIQNEAYALLTGGPFYHTGDGDRLKAILKSLADAIDLPEEKRPQVIFIDTGKNPQRGRNGKRLLVEKDTLDVVSMAEAGLTTKQIVKITKLGNSTVNRIRNEHGLSAQKGSGRIRHRDG